MSNLGKRFSDVRTKLNDKSLYRLNQSLYNPFTINAEGQYLCYGRGSRGPYDIGSTHYQRLPYLSQMDLVSVENATIADFTQGEPIYQINTNSKFTFHTNRYPANRKGSISMRMLNCSYGVPSMTVKVYVGNDQQQYTSHMNSSDTYSLASLYLELSKYTNISTSGEYGDAKIIVTFNGWSNFPSTAYCKLPIMLGIAYNQCDDYNHIVGGVI